MSEGGWGFPGDGGEFREATDSFPQEDGEREGDKGGGGRFGAPERDASGSDGSAGSNKPVDLRAAGTKSGQTTNTGGSSRQPREDMIYVNNNYDPERRLPPVKVWDLTAISIVARINVSQDLIY